MTDPVIKIHTGRRFSMNSLTGYKRETAMWGPDVKQKQVNTVDKYLKETCFSHGFYVRGIPGHRGPLCVLIIISIIIIIINIPPFVTHRVELPNKDLPQRRPSLTGPFTLQGVRR